MLWARSKQSDSTCSACIRSSVLRSCVLAIRSTIPALKRAHASRLCVSCRVVVRPHVARVSGTVMSLLGVFWCLVLCFLEYDWGSFD